MTTYDLGLLPSGRLHCFPSNADDMGLGKTMQVISLLLILKKTQAIKNPAARQTKAVKKLKAKSRIALTGTPVENRLSDLWSLLDFLNPGLLGSATRFKGFVKSLSERKSDQYAPLRNLVAPYILRRLKTDRSIIKDLPEKTEVNAYCGLSKRQAVLYQQSVTQMAENIENLEGINRRGLVLSYLMRFKQICNHPSQLLGDGEYDPKQSGKFQRLAELCEEIASRQEKLLVFTQFREMIAPLASFLAQQFGQAGLVLHGGTPVNQRHSVKVYWTWVGNLLPTGCRSTQSQAVSLCEVVISYRFPVVFLLTNPAGETIMKPYWFF